MPLKSRVLDWVHRMNGLFSRDDLPPRDTTFAPSTTGPSTQTPEPVLSNGEHLGPYRPLIAAVRDELEHFVASHVRLHLAIADHDRFLLTSIGVRCPDDGKARQLLQQFMREFKPEQIKRYLAREVIAALPNAATIDLTQFAGLFDADAQADADEGGEYGELLAALRSAPPSQAPRPHQVSIVGRWTEVDPARLPAASTRAADPATLQTPLAGQRFELDVEDGDGKRSVVLNSVIPGRRYVLGKGEGCDIRANGIYTSRRHGEIWLENGSWWVADAGSTNGIRVESATGLLGRSGSQAGPGAKASIELPEGARIVLSAQSEGNASEYPWVMLRPRVNTAPRVTPIAAASPKTPLTTILPARSRPLALSACTVTGTETMPLRAGSLPITVGRSRNQTLVIARAHEAVSGHHLDIVDLDDTGATVAVHGDNGVGVDGIVYAPGTRFRWNAGETMVLGRARHDEPECTLTLLRAGDD